MNSQDFSGTTESRPGLKVLYLPKANRSDYFRRLLLHGKEHQGWTISVPGQGAHQAMFEPIVADGGQFHTLIDFTREQDWEADQSAVAALDARIAECERFNRVPANRLLLSGSRNLGRGFGLTRQIMPSNRQARYALSDSTAGFRGLRRMFHFAFEMLESSKPDIVIAGEWTSPFYYATVLAARMRGIKCFANRNSKIISDNFFWTSDLLMFNDRSWKSAKELGEARAGVSREAEQRIEAFRNRPETLGYVGKKWVKRETRSLREFHMPYLRLFAGQTLARLRGAPLTQPDPALGMLLSQYRKGMSKALNRKYFRTFDEDELKALRFVYFPLHKEGEVALTFQAPAWYDQANTIRQLAIALPAGYRLVVREHRANHGSRPSRWYRHVSRLPNVILVDPFGSQFPYLRHAALVVTENGTSGWEALLLGKRVLTLARCHYDGAGLSRYVADPSELPSAILDLLSRAPVADAELHDRHLGWQIDAELAHSFSGDVAHIPEAIQFLSKH